MILIDANVFMYAAGKASPQRGPCQAFLERAGVAGGPPCCTDAEVLQEILHRYRAMDRPDLAFLVFDTVVALGIPILGVGEDEVRRARRLLATSPALSTRDAVHVGVMEANGLTEVLTYDKGFDAVAWVKRREP